MGSFWKECTNILWKSFVFKLIILFSKSDNYSKSLIGEMIQKVLIFKKYYLFQINYLYYKQMALKLLTSSAMKSGFLVLTKFACNYKSPYTSSDTIKAATNELQVKIFTATNFI